MNPSEQAERVENDTKDTQSTDLSSGLWNDMKQGMSDVKNVVSGMIPNQILDFSDDIFGGKGFDKMIQQSGPAPLGDVQNKVPGKEHVATGETQPSDVPGKPTGEVDPAKDQFDPKDAVNGLDGQTKEFNIDDYQSVTLEDGTLITNSPDGMITVKSPDGTRVQYNPDGSKFSSYPDGTTVSEEADGTKWTKTPDGKMHSEHTSLMGKLWDMIPTF